MKIFIILLIICSNAFTQNNNSEVRTLFNINNISTWVYNNGSQDGHPNGNSGFQYPRGSDQYLVFKSGLLWGGIIDDEIRVGGSTYAEGLVPGRILSNGLRETETPVNQLRVFRVRPDWQTADLSSEINDGEGTEAEIRSHYELDWNEWPAESGAPYQDIDNDGIYNPSIDIPGVYGADQTLWYVANDLDTAACRNLYGSDPIGIELQVTIWGYKDFFPQNNIMYKKYRLINKSGRDIKDMYISQWADTEVGDASDDYVGCDTSLALGYGYNSDDFDGYGFSDMIIPAIGFQIMKGVSVTDSITGKTKDLSMSTFIRNLKNSLSNFDDPNLRDYQLGTLPTYNFMNGKGSNGDPIINPNSGKATKFDVSGDPVNNTGWIEENDIYSAGDRRLLISSGPFDMESGDVQEVIIAQIAALGENRLKSLEFLKDYAEINLNTNIKFSHPQLITPKVTKINWGATREIELEILNKEELLNFDQNEYKFQGINFYLSEVDLDQNVQTIKKTYDIIDENKYITSGVEYNGKIFSHKEFTGNDTGIPNTLIINEDPFTGSPLIPGKTYYYRISAYYLNETSDLPVIESQYEFNKIIYLKDNDLFQYGDTVLLTNLWEENIGIDIRTINPYQVESGDYKLVFHENTNEFYFDLTNTSTGSVVINNQKLYDFITNEEYSFSEEIDGNLIKIELNDGVFAFNSGFGIEEIYFDGYKNPISTPVWSYYSKNYYSIKSSHFYRNNSDNLIKHINHSRPYDYELRFTDEINYGIQFFTTNKVVSVPFELWNIGTDSPEDTSDDVRLIPFISEYEERDYWGFSDSVTYSIRENEYIYPYPISDEIFWMFPDKQAGGYDQFAAKCTEIGVGNIYDPQLDDSPQGYYVDFKEDTSYAIGNMVVTTYYDAINIDEFEIPEGTIIRFTSTESLEGREYNFTVSEILNPQINFKYELFQNYPNPFNPITRIRYFLPEDGLVSINIYNVLGQKVTTLLNEEMKAGKYETEFNGSNLASGIYIYRIDSENFTETKKMLLLK